MRRSTALAQGFTIDDGQRPVAYKGPRFRPNVLIPLRTEEEENSRVFLQMLCEKIESFLQVPSSSAVEALASARQEVINYLQKERTL